jgi:hypothetical protein
MAAWILIGVLVLFLVLVLVPRMYRQRRDLTEGARLPMPAVPARLVSGADRTWVVFTTPSCTSVGAVESMLRAHDPAAKLVEVDATLDPALAQAFHVRRAPTVLLADATGRVRARLVGAEGVEAYLRNPK